MYFGGYFGANAAESAAFVADGATTFETIRNQQVAVIEALTPTKIAGHGFRAHREQAEYMAWVEKNPAASLRRFQILSGLDIEASPSSDGHVELWRHTFELRVAYPRQFGRYGKENERDMEDVIELDIRQIDGAIGRHGFANYVAGQQLCERESTGVVDLAGAKVLSITYLVQYDRSV